MRRCVKSLNLVNLINCVKIILSAVNVALYVMCDDETAAACCVFFQVLTPFITRHYYRLLNAPCRIMRQGRLRLLE